MKKLFILMGAIVLALTLTACGEECEVCETLAELPDTVDMTNIDEYLARPDVQYVDLRNFDDKMSAGYIAGFEMIPFFDYLEATNILVRTDGDWEFAAEDLVSQAALEGLFNADKAIFLMCGSGTRAGYVKAALEAAGYTNVYNVGGIGNYTGDNLVLGDGTYNLEVQLPLPSVVDMTNIDQYLARNDVQYVDLRNFDDKMASGYIAGFEMIPFFDYLEETGILVRTDGDWTFAAEDILNQAALEGLFNADKTIFLMCGSGTRAGYVKDALESIGYTNVVNVGGIGSYTGDNLVFGDGEYQIVVPEQGDYIPGTYYGYADGYSVVITVGAGGAIESVFLDCANTSHDGLDTFLGLKQGLTPEEYPMNYVTNDNGTPLDDTDDFLELAEGKLDWWMQADALAAAIIEEQGWVWTLVDGDFDVDGVAGVSIGVENWETAVLAALDQATAE
jgi:rhodanese-related sulfurtransferase